MADAEEVFSDEEMLLLVLMLFTRETQRRKHKRKHKKKERFPFLVLALMLASPQFTRWVYAYTCIVRVNQPFKYVLILGRTDLCVSV